MSRSRLSLLASSILWLLSAVTVAQTQASCTFSFFPLSVNIPSLGSGFIDPLGVNDFSTIVGRATLSNDQITPNQVAFIRWANGGFTFPLGKGGPSSLVHRNDSGISIGDIGGVPLLLNGTTVMNIDFTGLGSQLQSVNGVTGINKWNSIVGSYNTSSAVNAFKRFGNGGFTTLRFPGSSSTFPTGINDSGTVVGSYFVGPAGVQLPENGFVYHNGQWATLNYPGALFTNLTGISNGGVIIGNAVDTVGGFLYQNGVFKVISAPGGASTVVVDISPVQGFILGTSNAGGFIAKCH